MALVSNSAYHTTTSDMWQVKDSYIEAKMANVAILDNVIAAFNVYQTFLPGRHHVADLVQDIKMHHFSPDKATFHVGVYSAGSLECDSPMG